MNAASGNVTTATIDEAVEWYLRHRSQALSAGDRRQFAAWLRASPLNVKEYLAIAALSGDMPMAADVAPAELQMLIARARERQTDSVLRIPRPAGEERYPRPKRGVWAMAAMFVVAVVGGALFWAFAQHTTTYSTDHGEQRTIRLSDGSLLQLNSGTRVVVNFTERERLIDLEAGQLMLGVFRDPARPLRVRAGEAEVLAVGTKFDVYRKTDEVTVTVVEGRVLVHAEGRHTAEEPGIALTMGQQVRLARAIARPKAIDVDLPTATAWLQGTIKFFRQPLAEVAAEFNRYSSTPVQIDGATLRELRVSGVFNAYDIESFIEFVRRLDGVEVRRSAEQIRVVSRSNPAP